CKTKNSLFVSSMPITFLFSSIIGTICCVLFNLLRIFSIDSFSLITRFVSSIIDFTDSFLFLITFYIFFIPAFSLFYFLSFIFYLSTFFILCLFIHLYTIYII